MFGECHAHIFMDGVNYQEALKRQQNGVREDWIRQVFSWYQEKEITYVREGGDNLGVSLRAKEIAPEYGIEYRSPVFAIHKNGHYGGIVGYYERICSFGGAGSQGGGRFYQDHDHRAAGFSP